jgi:hypothetical protein
MVDMQASRALGGHCDVQASPLHKRAISWLLCSALSIHSCSSFLTSNHSQDGLCKLHAYPAGYT